jgi:hypothetical protein
LDTPLIVGTIIATGGDVPEINEAINGLPESDDPELDRLLGGITLKDHSCPERFKVRPE